tara:strand:- start:313 stop:915 length:603 start_codon:yes stop_codon:yes gene_type:complete
MNTVVLILLILVVLMTMSRTEMFTEQFGFSGYTKSKDPITIEDNEINLSEYEESGEDVEVSNDLMQEMVLATNKEVSKKTGLCTYIIETTSVKKYTHTTSRQEIYRCMFMSVKHKGFALGFAVTSDMRIIDGKAIVISLRTQPIDYRPPSDPSIYQKSIIGKEFEDYTEVRQSEIDHVKNGKIIEKVISDPQTMYGKIQI